MKDLALQRGTPFMALANRNQVLKGRPPCTQTLQAKPTRDLVGWTSLGCLWVTDTNGVPFWGFNPLHCNFESNLAN